MSYERHPVSMHRSSTQQHTHNTRQPVTTHSVQGRAREVGWWWAACMPITQLQAHTTHTHTTTVKTHSVERRAREVGRRGAACMPSVHVWRHRLKVVKLFFFLLLIVLWLCVCMSVCVCAESRPIHVCCTGDVQCIRQSSTLFSCRFGLCLIQPNTHVIIALTLTFILAWHGRLNFRQ